MNCHTCRSLILEYLEGALPPEATGQMEAHTSGCPACRMELAMAQKIEGALLSRKLRMPPADFTVRVLTALPEGRVIAGTFWSQMLPPMAYAASILAFLLGLGRYLPYLSQLYEAWSDRLSTLAFVLGLQGPETPGEPGHLEAALHTFQETASEGLGFLAAFSEQVQGLYSTNAPTVHLGVAALALVWVVYDYRQGAKE